MTADHFINIEQFNAGLWKVADELRANSNLASNEYFLPIMGLLFLRQATNRYYEALAAIQAEQAVGKKPVGVPLNPYFVKRRAMMLPDEARSPALRLPGFFWLLVCRQEKTKYCPVRLGRLVAPHV